MKTIEKVKMYENIQKHGENLNAIFNTGIDPVKLYKSLFRLEKKAHHAITCLCNTNTLDILELKKYTGYYVNKYTGYYEQATEAEQDKFFEGIKKQVVKILGKDSDKCFFINFDPSGYALKLKSEFCEGKQIYKDFGGFGIIAPDFTQNN